ncbi:twin-arginine translocase subunit TatC, partial [Rhodococcus ruber]|nr:twin-arginine translocase subunit TatC [Rhodococcus ruber]
VLLPLALPRARLNDTRRARRDREQGCGDLDDDESAPITPPAPLPPPTAPPPPGPASAEYSDPV